LAYKAVGVFVGAPLPGGVGVGEIGPGVERLRTRAQIARVFDPGFALSSKKLEAISLRRYSSIAGFGSREAYVPVVCVRSSGGVAAKSFRCKARDFRPIRLDGPVRE